MEQAESQLVSLPSQLCAFRYKGGMPLVKLTICHVISSYQTFHAFVYDHKQFSLGAPSQLNEILDNACFCQIQCTLSPRLNLVILQPPAKIQD